MIHNAPDMDAQTKYNQSKRGLDRKRRWARRNRSRLGRYHTHWRQIRLDACILSGTEAEARRLGCWRQWRALHKDKEMKGFEVVTYESYMKAQHRPFTYKDWKRQQKKAV